MEASKSKRTGYWLVTGFFAVFMTLSAVAQDFPRGPDLLKTIAHLGYPPYLPLMVGTAKLLGVAALLAPGFLILKEWAYAGFTILFLSAFVSHLASGDGPMAIAPLVALGILAGSYALRPAERRITFSH